MNTLFIPAMVLMNRLKYKAKFALLFAIIFVPLIVLTTMLINDISESIRFVRHEQQGLAYLKAIRPLLAQVPAHRGLVNTYLSGNTQVESDINTLRRDVDQSLQLLTKTDEEIGGSLKTQGVVAKLQKQWDELKQTSLKLPVSQSFEKHGVLMKDVIALLELVADAAEITLDPKLDSYYLGDAIINKMPGVIDAIGQARALSTGAVTAGALTAKDRIRLTVLLDHIEIATASMKKGLKAAFESNPAVATRLQAMVAQSQQQSDKFDELVKLSVLQPEKMTITGTEVFEAGTNAVSGLLKLYDGIVPTLEGLFTARLDSERSKKYASIAVTAGMLLLIAYLFTGLYLSVVDNILKTMAATSRMAEGDLTARLHLQTQDEMNQIAQGFNLMGEKVEGLIQQILSSATQLSAATEEVSAVAAESSCGAEQQRSETDQVATAMNEMAATVREVAKNAEQAAKSAAGANDAASSGRTVVDQTTAAISQLADSVENAANVIADLNKNSETIGTVLDVIKGIAEQTNLLALNAAIEAARAGEQGRGFAVVADEVRTLAQRTQKSTTEIEEMISRLQVGAKNAVTAMEGGRAQAKVGVMNSAQAGAALDAISQAVSKIMEMNAQIASAAEEQSAVAEEMNKNIINISQVAEHTASGSSQTRAASDELSRLATKLQSLVAQFKIRS